MRVILNGVSTLKPKTGVGHTTANLHRALAGLGGGDAYWLYPGPWAGGLAGRVLKNPLFRSFPTRRPVPTPDDSGKTARDRSRLARPGAAKRGAGMGTAGGPPADPLTLREVAVDLAKAAYRLHFRAAARPTRFDLYHEPNFVPVATRLPTVVTVHDLSVVLYPDYHPADRVKFHERHFRRGLDAAAHVVAVSESVRRDAIHFLGLAPDRITAVHNGIDSRFRPQSPEAIEAVRRRLGLPARYALAVGTIEPRKNILTLLRAYCDLPAAAREACRLVLAGGWGWMSDPVRELFEGEGRAKGAVHLGYVPDEDLPGLYAGAAALFYPSVYEGFGLPPVEMLACGGGVVASTDPAVREVVGRHARLIDPYDSDGWRDALHRVAVEPDYLAESRRGGVAHARQFTWERAAVATRDVYRQVLGLDRGALPSARAA